MEPGLGEGLVLCPLPPPPTLAAVSCGTGALTWAVFCSHMGVKTELTLCAQSPPPWSHCSRTNLRHGPAVTGLPGQLVLWGKWLGRCWGEHCSCPSSGLTARTVGSPLWTPGSGLGATPPGGLWYVAHLDGDGLGDAEDSAAGGTGTFSPASPGAVMQRAQVRETSGPCLLRTC